MNYTVIITAIITVLFLITAIAFVLTKKREQENNRKARELIPEIRSFYDDFNKDEYIVHSDELRIREKYRELLTKASKISLKKNSDVFETVRKFRNDYSDLHSYVENLNRRYIQSENSKYDALLSDIDGKSLDMQQREAVISDEEHNLVIAGAGSGKTLTISGKVKYLCETKGIKPEDILLITFTRKAAQEMTDRIATKLGYHVQATTFHKLGLDILKESGSGVYDVKDDMRQFFEDYFSKNIDSDKDMLQNLINFFAYYLLLPSDMKNFDSLGDMYEHEKSMDLETIKSKYDKASFVDENKFKNSEAKLTLKQEKVKSLQEMEIANFLFLHGIRYEYEAKYPFQDDESNRRVYRPDFYLPDYDIYLEHFGVDENYTCPWLSPIEEDKYVEGMLWKKEWHRKNKTKLLCTYSYYYSKGILLTELERMLKENGVQFRDIDLADVFNAVYKTQGKKYFSEFISLCCTFISLFKSNGYELADLDRLDYKSKQYDNNFFRNRLKVFKDIIRKLLVVYNGYLKDSNAFDFSDMINLSTRTIRNGHQVHKYEYVIIDEFQDTSVARYRLVKAILDQTGAKFLCVGDDWQSIYRFAGSDISFFTSFSEYFGYTKIMKIEKTYRNSQQLIDEVGRFIMKNPQQIKKNLISGKSLDSPISFWNYYGDDAGTELRKIMDYLLNRSGSSSSILLLGRTNYDFEIIKNTGMFYGKDIEHLHYKYSPDTPISFLTVHRSKGLEADNVILLNFENSVLGFPNKIADDPMLEIVLSKADEYMYAEERRLLYVALTRTKNRVCVLVNGDRPSEFLTDFPATDNVQQMDLAVDQSDTETLCPKCKTGHLVRRKNEKTGAIFIGCSNYPKCDYTLNSTKAVEEKKRCPRCGGFLTLRPGKYGAFYGCSNYPNCQYTEEFDEYKRCPECGAEMKIRKGKNGLFWGCTNYPSCRHTEKY